MLTIRQTPISIFSRVKSFFTPLKWGSSPQDANAQETEESFEVPANSTRASNASSPTTRNANAEKAFSFPPPSIPRPFETRDALSLESHEVEAPQSPIAHGHSISPNQMLADFFQQKGAEPLSEVEAAGVISILASTQESPKTLSSSLVSPTLSKCEESPSPSLTPGGLEKSVNGLQSQEKGSPGADLLFSTFIHSPTSSKRSPKFSPKTAASSSLSSSSNFRTSLPRARPSESVSQNSKISHHDKSLYNTPNVNSSDSLISTVPVSFFRSSSKIDLRERDPPNSRNTPSVKTPIHTTSPLQSVSRSVSQNIKSSPLDQNHRTPSFVDKYKPLRSSALRQSTIRSPSSSPVRSNIVHVSSSPASQKKADKTPTKSVPYETNNITPTWAVPDFVDDDVYDFSNPASTFTSISPSKPLYPRIKPLTASGTASSFIFAVPGTSLDLASGDVSLEQEPFTAPSEIPSEAIVSEIFTNHLDQPTSIASVADSKSETEVISESSSEESSKNSLQLRPMISASQETEFSNHFKFPTACITSPPNNLSFEKLEGYKQSFNF